MTKRTHPADDMYAEVVETARDAIRAGRHKHDGVNVADALTHVRDNAHDQALVDAATELLAEVNR